GTGVSPNPVLTVGPVSLNFGGVAIGSSSTGTLSLSNTGNASLVLDTVELPADPFFVSGAPAPGRVLQAGDTVLVSVTFMPTVPGSYTDEFSVTSSGGDGLVGLSGQATLPAHMTLTPSALDAGFRAVGDEAVLSFTLSNTG